MKALLLEITLPFALLLLAGSLLLYYVAVGQDGSARALADDPGRAVARLTDKTIQATTRRDKDGVERTGPATHVLHYEYTHPETGQLWQCTASTGREVWESMEVGGHYEVIFSKADPQLASLFEGREFQAGARLAERLAQAGGVLGICLLLLRHWLRRAKE